MMDYSSMKNTAKRLLSQFGNTKDCVLLKRTNGVVEEHKGVGVKLKYNSEAVDGNIIKMGDAKILCQFDVTPTEMVDIIKFGNESYSIINTGDLSPGGSTKILYTLQVRRQG